jgi:hypothetical protein
VLTVVCWKWNGWRPVYTAKHVNVLERMLQKNLRVPHRLVCVTDDPTGVRCETMPLWDFPKVETKEGRPNCYPRLRLFSDEAKEMFGERVLSIDLDCIIVDDITDLITDDDFKIVKGISAPYNGSMWLHTCGTRTHLWDDFDPASSPGEAAEQCTARGKRFYGSDQAWMSFKAPGEPTWGQDDGVYQFTTMPFTKPPKPNTRVVFFAGRSKPWDFSLKTACKRLFEIYRGYLRTEA